jgi:hypothetical protein
MLEENRIGNSLITTLSKIPRRNRLSKHSLKEFNSILTCGVMIQCILSGAGSNCYLVQFNSSRLRVLCYCDLV